MIGTARAIDRTPSRAGRSSAAIDTPAVEPADVWADGLVGKPLKRKRVALDAAGLRRSARTRALRRATGEVGSALFTRQLLYRDKRGNEYAMPLSIDRFAREQERRHWGARLLYVRRQRRTERARGARQPSTYEPLRRGDELDLLHLINQRVYAATIVAAAYGRRNSGAARGFVLVKGLANIAAGAQVLDAGAFNAAFEASDE